MKKKQAAAALALLTAISSLCLRGMKAVGDRILRKENEKLHTFDDAAADEE